MDRLFEVRLCLSAYEMALRGEDTEVLDAAHDAMSVHAPDHYRLMLAEVDCLAASLAAMTAERGRISRFATQLELDYKNMTANRDEFKTMWESVKAERDEWQRRAEAAEQGEEMRPADKWHEDHGWVLWWEVPEDGSNIEEFPFFGNPLCSDWEDRPFEPTHYTLVKVRDPIRRGPVEGGPVEGGEGK